MKNKLIWLKISFMVGAILDLLVGIQMICYDLVDKIYKIKDFNPTGEFKFAIWTGASLMLGWTVLLIWGFLKPFERKGLLLITIFPVITGLIITEIIMVISGYINLNIIIKTWIMQITLIILFLFSYLNAKIENK
jgi:hypothetical protein